MGPAPRPEPAASYTVAVRILFASSEVYPYSKTGGLADVAGALPEALARLGHEVLVVTPWYPDLDGARPLWIGDVEIPFDGGGSAVGVGTLEQGGVRLAFVGHEDFRREKIYGYDDDVYRFCRFTRSIPPVAARVGFRPDVVHVHDWHAAYLPLLLRHGRQLPAGFAGLATVLTIHNAQYQGESAIRETVRWLLLPEGLADERIEHFGRANALKAGAVHADRVTTVSPSYARELISPEYGYSLEETFRALRHQPVGILNGIDTATWNPARDPFLPAAFDSGDLGGKAAAKRDLCSRFGLDPERPLLAVVSRLAEQKGIDLLIEATGSLEAQGWSLFLLGTGDPRLEAAIDGLALASGSVSAQLAFDEALSHLVYAAADALAIPSRFEPCGLSQMIAMRYGTLPIARATGGLRDTITHLETGFLFDDASPAALAAAAGEAARLFGSEEWDRMMLEAMARDFSWEASARGYGDLYRDLLRESGRGERMNR